MSDYQASLSQPGGGSGQGGAGKLNVPFTNSKTDDQASLSQPEDGSDPSAQSEYAHGQTGEGKHVRATSDTKKTSVLFGTALFSAAIVLLV